MAEKSLDDFQKFDDLDQLLNNALNELNNPTIIKDANATDDQKPLDQNDDLNALTDTFKKLMDPSNESAFDETMFETLRKLEENIKNIPEDAQVPSEEEMASIWADMTSGQSEGGDGDVFPPFFMDIMQKLLAKDVLYPPLKELSTKFPEWLDENKNKLSEDEYARYCKQHELVDQVCGYYEEEEAKGPIESKRFQKILTAMQEMQQCGQPPEGLVSNQNGTAFQPTSMDDFNKLMEESGGMDQCKTM